MANKFRYISIVVFILGLIISNILILNYYYNLKDTSVKLYDLSKSYQ